MRGRLRPLPAALHSPPLFVTMAGSKTEALIFLLVCLLVVSAAAEGPYRSYDWKVTYGDINPLGTPQQVQTKFGSLDSIC